MDRHGRSDGALGHLVGGTPVITILKWTTAFAIAGLMIVDMLNSL